MVEGLFIIINIRIRASYCNNLPVYPIIWPFFIVEQEGVYVLLVFTQCRKIAFNCDHKVKLDLQL